jgi:hypothetical protein
MLEAPGLECLLETLTANRAGGTDQQRSEEGSGRELGPIALVRKERPRIGLSEAGGSFVPVVSLEDLEE